MPKIIGLIVAWNCEQFIEPCIKQALEYCDEVLICVSPHTKEMERFKDATFEIAFEFSKLPNVKLFKSKGRSNHALEKANILNGMLSVSDYFKAGNWIWILDADEFYTKDTYNRIRQVIEEDKYNAIRTSEKYFYINMQHYLKNNRCRLRKIKSKEQRFYPTQQWPYTENEIMLEDCCMFHYGAMPNPWAKIAFWKGEYKGTGQDTKVDWINKIYKNYDLNNEKYWITKNEELFGVRSPWFTSDFKAQEDGTLFKYDGKHPEYVKNLEDIKDFRILYNFNWRSTYADFVSQLNPSIGAEIGVWEGANSIELLKQIPNLKKLYCVDTWKSYDDFSNHISNQPEEKRDFVKAKKIFEESIRSYSDRVEKMHMSSEEASKLVKDESLDFVFIDANHAYKYVKQDIELWSPKVKKGGLISGHDYINDPEDDRHDVKLAVDEIFSSNCVSGVIWWTIKE